MLFFLYDYMVKRIITLHHKHLRFLWLLDGKERLTSFGESEPEEMGSSFSWQDSGSFLCLSRKCKKSDSLVFHLHTHRTRASISTVMFGQLGLFAVPPSLTESITHFILQNSSVQKVCSPLDVLYLDLFIYSWNNFCKH